MFQFNHRIIELKQREILWSWRENPPKIVTIQILESHILTIHVGPITNLGEKNSCRTQEFSKRNWSFNYCFAPSKESGFLRCWSIKFKRVGIWSVKLELLICRMDTFVAIHIGGGLQSCFVWVLWMMADHYIILQH